MIEKDNKIIYSSQDFEDTIKNFSWHIPSLNIALFSIYQGSMTLCHRLSKQYNLPHSIIKYQHVDGKDEYPTVLYHALDDYSKHDIVVVDDIFDTGKTFKSCFNLLVDIFNENNQPKSIRGYAIFSNAKYPNNVLYQHFNIEKKWVHFEPWEGMYV